MRKTTIIPIFTFTLIFSTFTHSAIKTSTPIKKIPFEQLITQQSITNDLQFLASDELKGRGNFTPELQLAANYIAKRFHSLDIKAWPNNQFLLPKDNADDNIDSSLLKYFQTFEITTQQAKKLKKTNNIFANNKLTNVVAYIPGKTKSEEIILFSAHYDHIGFKKIDTETLDNTAQQDIIFNGADDNASGVTAVLQLAQYYKEYYKNKNNARTIMFVAFAGEELGGFGSQYFSKSLVPDNIIAMINIEMIGKPSSFGIGKGWLTGFNYSNLGLLLNQHIERKNSNINSKNNWKIYPDPYPKFNLFYRSDNATLARLGVPAHTISASQIDKDEHYHKVSDQIETLDITSMQKLIQNLALASTGLIDGKITPTRIPPEHLK